MGWNSTHPSLRRPARMGEIFPQHDPTCHPRGFSLLLRGSQSSSPSSPISTLLIGEVPHILTMWNMNHANLVNQTFRVCMSVPISQNFPEVLAMIVKHQFSVNRGSLWSVTPEQLKLAALCPPSQSVSHLFSLHIWWWLVERTLSWR